jgi:hypothetical protein
MSWKRRLPELPGGVTVRKIKNHSQHGSRFLMTMAQQTLRTDNGLRG